MPNEQESGLAVLLEESSKLIRFVQQAPEDLKEVQKVVGVCIYPESVPAEGQIIAKCGRFKTDRFQTMDVERLRKRFLRSAMEIGLKPLKGYIIQQNVYLYYYDIKCEEQIFKLNLRV